MKLLPLTALGKRNAGEEETRIFLGHYLVVLTWPNFGQLFFTMGNKRYKLESKMGNMEILLSRLSSTCYLWRTESMEGFVLISRNTAIETQSRGKG